MLGLTRETKAKEKVIYTQSLRMTRQHFSLVSVGRNKSLNRYTDTMN